MSNFHVAIPDFPRGRESFLPKYHLILPKYHLILPKFYSFPPEEFPISSVGIEKFLCWNSKVPPLELKGSSVGTKKFQKGNYFWNSYA